MHASDTEFAMMGHTETGKRHMGVLKFLYGWFMLDAIFTGLGFTWDLFTVTNTPGTKPPTKPTMVFVVTGLEILFAVLRLYFVWKIAKTYKEIGTPEDLDRHATAEWCFHVCFFLTWIGFYYLANYRTDTMHRKWGPKLFWVGLVIDLVIWAAFVHRLGNITSAFKDYRQKRIDYHGDATKFTGYQELSVSYC
jgi:hypothetical protein